MNRRKFLQLSMIAPFVGAISCKDVKKPLVSKRKPLPRRHDLDSTSTKFYKYVIPPPGRYTVIQKVVRMKVTAYCPCSKCCGRYADGITASGYKIRKGDKFVAADKRYPFGTQMYVPGYHRIKGYPDNCYPQTMKVLDRGGAIKGNHIDVYFDTHQEALEWGVQYLDVTILCYEKGTIK